jgi:hypothetical protein
MTCSLEEERRRRHGQQITSSRFDRPSEADALPRKSDAGVGFDFGQSHGVDVALTSSSAFPEPLSPELVLVSPPEVARLARSLLSPEPPAAARAVEIAEREFGAAELTAVWAFSVAMTLGPLLMFVLVRLGQG